MGPRRAPVIGLLGLVIYDAIVRPRMLSWGASDEECHLRLPDDEITDEVMTHRTRAVTINAPPQAVWPWLLQIGDRRGGFYSYDWVERFVFPGTVHYVEGKHSATRIHPQLQNVRVGDRINTASVGRLTVGKPVTVLEPNRALVVGTWAFVLLPLPPQRTRMLVRERDAGWLRFLAPRRSGLLRALGGLVRGIAGLVCDG